MDNTKDQIDRFQSIDDWRGAFVPGDKALVEQRKILNERKVEMKNVQFYTAKYGHHILFTEFPKATAIISTERG